MTLPKALRNRLGIEGGDEVVVWENDRRILIDRDIKNVHGELTELERLGVVRFESAGRGKRPVFPYDEVVISLPFTDDTLSGGAPVES